MSFKYFMEHPSIHFKRVKGFQTICCEQSSEQRMDKSTREVVGPAPEEPPFWLVDVGVLGPAAPYDEDGHSRKSTRESRSREPTVNAPPG